MAHADGLHVDCAATLRVAGAPCAVMASLRGLTQAAEARPPARPSSLAS